MMVMALRKKLVGAVCALLTVTMLGACSSGGDGSGQSRSSATAAGGSGSGGQRVRLMWMGDSVAEQLEKPLSAAAEASGITFKSIAASGGGNVAGPKQISQGTFTKLGDALKSFHPSVVAYQVATYDWGSKQRQREAYQKLADTVTGAGAKLVIVTMPPIEPTGDFYVQHMQELERTDEVAKSVAESSDSVVVFDSTAVWGEKFSRRSDGELFRKNDGIHTCPEGAAQFTSWFMQELAQVAGFTPAPPEKWANAGWSGSKEFGGCGGGSAA